MPVAKPGFCRLKGSYTCFYRCPAGATQCPGGVQHTRCPKGLSAHSFRQMGIPCEGGGAAEGGGGP